VVASSIQVILPGVFHWSAYSPEHKVELSAHAVQHGPDFLLFDPIAVSAEVLDWFPPAALTAIVLTNGNHLRDAAIWRERFQTPIFATPDAGLDPGMVQALTTDPLPFAGWKAVHLPGGPPGEHAYILPSRSLAVFGDALVNLPGRGLEVLPARYCQDQARLRTALRELTLDKSWTTAVFAHGTPLIEDARARISGVL
jgi:glyoxylase-like metal-dependent hydrolase (beta-lactamase superfamily II)